MGESMCFPYEKKNFSNLTAEVSHIQLNENFNFHAIVTCENVTLHQKLKIYEIKFISFSEY